MKRRESAHCARGAKRGPASAFVEGLNKVCEDFVECPELLHQLGHLVQVRQLL